jgi:hypothetical protein
MHVHALQSGLAEGTKIASVIGDAVGQYLCSGQSA